MDHDLDDLLRASAPALTARTDQMVREMDLLVAATEAAAIPRKRRAKRRVGLVGLAAAGLLGLGVAASASGLVDPPWATTASQPLHYPGPSIHADEITGGTNCRIVFGASDFEDPKHPVSKEDRYAASQHAKQFVLNFDLSTISLADAERRYRDEYAQMVASSAPPDSDLPGSESTHEGSPEDIKMWALVGEIDRRLQADLKSHGLSTHAASAWASPECETNTTRNEPREKDDLVEDHRLREDAQ